MTYHEILERLDFIKGNLIAGETRDVMQQLKELIELLREAEQKQIRPR
jgi:predicted RNase H-like HicB family nuclease